MKPAAITAIACLIAAGAGAAWVLLGSGGGTSELVAQTKAGLVYLPAGNFTAGNFEVDVRLADGTVERRPVSSGADALPPYEAAVEPVYMQDREATLAQMVIFAKQTGAAAPEQISDNPEETVAEVNWFRAEAYCAWLGDVAGLPMRLPTEVEWEYAARSGGAFVPFATDDGSFRYGVNVADNDRDTADPLPGTLPPNPYGLFDMVAGAYEWVSDIDADQPEARIAKGSSDQSTTFEEPIPDRYVVTPRSAEQMTALQPLFVSRGLAGSDYHPLDNGSAHPPVAGVRCVADVVTPPADSGFGKAPARNDFVAPEAFGPYDQMGNYLGDG